VAPNLTPKAEAQPSLLQSKLPSMAAKTEVMLHGRIAAAGEMNFMQKTTSTQQEETSKLAT